MLRPDQVWAGDICQRLPALPFGYLVPLGSFIPISAGWLYLAVVIGLCSRKTVGWSLAEHLPVDLVSDALKQALGSRRTLPGLIFHSDRGSQYGRGTFRALLRGAGMRQNISAHANPYHNA